MKRFRAIVVAAVVSALVACDARPTGKGPTNPEAQAKQSPVVAQGPEKDGDGDTAFIQEQEEPKGPIVLQVTSKLGVKTKVKVKDIMMPNVFQGHDTSMLAVDRGHGLYISIPLRQVKHIVNGEKESVVTLADGSIQKGHVRTKAMTDPELDDSAPGGFYHLSKGAVSLLRWIAGVPGRL